MIPQIDKEIGISIYTTNSPSIQGKIKGNQNDFLVKEILSEKIINSFNNDEGHAVYLLKKSGVDTNHALTDIEKQNLIPIFEHLRTIVYSVVLFSIILSAILIIFENNTTLDKIYRKILPFKD